MYERESTSHRNRTVGHTAPRSINEWDCKSWPCDRGTPFSSRQDRRGRNRAPPPSGWDFGERVFLGGKSRRANPEKGDDQTTNEQNTNTLTRNESHLTFSRNSRSEMYTPTHTHMRNAHARTRGEFTGAVVCRLESLEILPPPALSATRGKVLVGGSHCDCTRKRLPPPFGRCFRFVCCCLYAYVYIHRYIYRHIYLYIFLSNSHFPRGFGYGYGTRTILLFAFVCAYASAFGDVSKLIPHKCI